jgi:hypothetical protein
MAYVEAISNGGSGTTAARSNAIRSNYFERDRVIVQFNGDTWPVEKARMQIHETMGSEPTVADLYVKGGTQRIPERGQSVLIGHGTTTNRLFSGRVMEVERSVRRAADPKPDYKVTAVGPESVYSRSYVPYGAQAQSISAASIVKHFLLQADPLPSALQHTTEFVDPTLPDVGPFVARANEPCSVWMDRLAEITDSQWYVDYYSRLHFFQTTDPQPQPPAPLVSNSTTDIWNLRRRSDLSQVITEVMVTGGETTTLEDTSSMDARLPVAAIERLVEFGPGYKDNIDTITGEFPLYGTQMVLVDGRRRGVSAAYGPFELGNKQSIERASPISITSNSFWVGTAAQINSTTLGTIATRKWWSVLNSRFRVDSVSVTSTTANTIYGVFYTPAVGPGAPPPTAIAAIPPGTPISSDHYEIQVSDFPDTDYVVPRGSTVQGVYVTLDNSAGSSVASLLMNSMASTIRGVVHVPNGAGQDLRLAAAKALADGHPDAHVTVEFDTRDTRFAVGQKVQVILGAGAEVGGVTFTNTLTVTELTVSGFDNMGPRSGPIRSVTLGTIPKPTLYRMLAATTRKDAT